MTTDRSAKTAVSSLCDQLVRGTANEEIVVQALQECEIAFDAGQSIDRAALLAKYPQVRTELSACLDGLEMFRRSESDARSPNQVPNSSWDPNDNGEISKRTIGDFRIRRELGRGGMGVVYEAEQLSFGRRVALKVLPYAAMLDERKISRFQQEARAAATLEHPHIVPVYSVGNERGVYYYAMRLIEGKNLAEIGNDLQGLANQSKDPPLGSEIASNLTRVDRRQESSGKAGQLDTVAAASQETETSWMESQGTSSRVFYDSIARIGHQIAEALEFAHSQCILHRDIKPANIMLDQTGDAWITDFGLARMESAVAMTMTGDLVGTLRYMSPEQALAKRVAIDHRSDVYSLGATLYELLTLRPLFEAPDRAALLHQVAFNNPVSPAKIRATIPRDLETIVLKSLEKSPSDRYASAQLMADDLKRFIGRHPIAAKPPGIQERLRKWIQRNPSIAGIAAASACLVAIASVVATGIASTAYRNERTQREVAVEASEAAVAANQAAREALLAEQIARRDAQRSLYQAHMREAFDHLKRGRVRRAEALLFEHVPQPNESDARGWEWYFLLSKIDEDSEVISRFDNAINGITWTPDGRRFAAVGHENTVRVWESPSRTLIFEKKIPYARFAGAEFSPDGKTLAISSTDGSVRLWNSERDVPMTLLKPPSPLVTPGDEDPTWSPDGKRIALATISAVLVWDVENEKELLRIPSNVIEAIDWSPDGTEIAFGSAGGYLNIADAKSGDLLRKFRPHRHDLWSIDWNSDGTQLATGAFDRHAKIIDSQTGSVVKDFQHKAGVSDVQYSPDEKHLACGTCSHEITVWDIAENARSRTLVGHRHWVDSIDWSRYGKMLLSGSADHSLRLWDLPDHVEPSADRMEILRLHSGLGHGLLKHGPGEFIVRDLLANRDLHQFQASRAFWSPQGDRIATKLNQVIQILESQSGRVLVEFETPTQHHLTLNGWSSDGKILATMNPAGVHLWDSSSGMSLGQIDAPKCKGIYWSPTSPLIAIRDSKTINVWNAHSLRKVSSISNQPRAPSFLRLTTASWSPDGQLIATLDWSGVVRLWDHGTGQIVHQLDGHVADRPLWCIEWSQDGALLATGGWDQTVKVWDTRSGQEIHSLDGHTSTLQSDSMAFNATGSRLATVDDGGTIKLWDPRSGEEILTLAENGARTNLPHLHWAGDGHALIAHECYTTPGQNFVVYRASKGYQMEANGELNRLHAAKKRSLAASLFRSNRMQESESALREAEKIHPGSAESHLAWGRKFAIREMPSKAIRHFETAASLADSSSEPRNEFAWLLANRHDSQFRDPQHAERIARGLVAESPRQGEFWTTLGLALLRQQKWQEALDALDRALECISLGKSQIQWIRTICLVHLNRMSETQTSLEEAATAWEFEEGYNDALTYDIDRLREEALSLVAHQNASE